jgi:hypothetical protein
VILDAGIPWDWSRNGRFLLFLRLNEDRLWLLPEKSNPKPSALLGASSRASNGRFFPDTRWIAYESDESGSDEVYVQAFEAAAPGGPRLGSKQVISRTGGTSPRWRSDGKELFYLAPDGTIMAVKVQTSPIFKAEVPEPLFQAPSADWDVGPDGQRFLFLAPVGNSTPPPFTVVLNWDAGLKK